MINLSNYLKIAIEKNNVSKYNCVGNFNDRNKYFYPIY